MGRPKKVVDRTPRTPDLPNDDPQGADLSDSHKAFCWEYVYDYNKVRAYMKVYPDSKYNSAAVSANRLLSNAKINQYVCYLKENLAETANVSALMNILALKNFASISMADLMDDWGQFKDFSTLTPEQKAAIESIKVTYSRKPTIEVKLVNRLEAIEKLSKMLGWNAPKKVEKTTEHRTFVIGLKKGIKEAVNN